AFYTIIKHIREHNIKAKQLTNQIFDYIFYGQGNVEALSKISGISSHVIDEMRKEFEYWYPVDLRVSAKELVPNHLSFFIFHHTALFPKNLWPRGIGVNGMLSIEGRKMSKSKGNFLTLRSILDRYGADVTRLTLVLGAEDMDDPDWREENAKGIEAKLLALRRFIDDLVNLLGDEKLRTIDRWLLSTIQKRVKMVTEALNKLKTRTAAEIAFFEVWNDIRWYMRRIDTPNTKVVREVTDIWIRLISPFTPYLAEELWHLIGKKEFVSLAEWPVYDDSKIDITAEEVENLLKNLIEDTTNIIKVTRIIPKRICYYVAAQWKWKAYLKTLQKSLTAKVEMKDVIKELLKDPEIQKKVKDLTSFLNRNIMEINMIAEEVKKRKLKTGVLCEKSIIEESKNFLQKELNAVISVYNEEDLDRYDPKNRASQSKPYRPAIYIE
ncbi:MAG: class I tRNA ligase family protein, partial [Candidatus Jordarchaeaceae archaeon]